MSGALSIAGQWAADKHVALTGHFFHPRPGHPGLPIAPHFNAPNRAFSLNTVALSTIWDDLGRPAVLPARHRTALAEGIAAHLLPDAPRPGQASAGDDALLEDLVNRAGRSASSAAPGRALPVVVLEQERRLRQGDRLFSQ